MCFHCHPSSLAGAASPPVRPQNVEREIARAAQRVGSKTGRAVLFCFFAADPTRFAVLEGAIHRSLSHPNFLRLHYYLQDHSRHFLLLHMVEDGSLEQRIKEPLADEMFFSAPIIEVLVVIYLLYSDTRLRSRPDWTMSTPRTSSTAI